MAGNKRRNFSRKTDIRSYKKLFLIATEGTKTEPQYFNMFRHSNNIVDVRCIKGSSKSAPKYVLNTMKSYLKKINLRKDDEAWLVIDKDMWSDSQIKELFDWTKKNIKYNLAVSNPKFEYWLLLHFEEGKNANTPSSCVEKLRKYLPDYNKNIDIRKITIDKIIKAIEVAEKKDVPPCIDWPREAGKTTVYRLVKKLVEIGN